MHGQSQPGLPALLLQLCSTAEDAPLFEAYAHDEYLADVAIRGLISTPGSEEILAGLIRDSERPGRPAGAGRCSKRSRGGRADAAPLGRRVRR